MTEGFSMLPHMEVSKTHRTMEQMSAKSNKKTFQSQIWKPFHIHLKRKFTTNKRRLRRNDTEKKSVFNFAN